MNLIELADLLALYIPQTTDGGRHVAAEAENYPAVRLGAAADDTRTPGGECLNGAADSMESRGGLLRHGCVNAAGSDGRRSGCVGPGRWRWAR